MFGSTQIAPTVLICTERQDSLALCRKAKVGGNNREDALLDDHTKELWRNYMDAAEGQWDRLFRGPNDFGGIGPRLSST